MRGVRTLGRRGPQAAPEQLAEEGARIDADRRAALGEIEVADVPARRRCSSATGCCACRSCAASSRSASRWRSASRRSASPPTRSCPRRRSRSPAACGSATIVFALALAVGLFFVVPVGADEPDQGPARLGRSCSGSSRASCAPRSSSATSCCYRAHARPAPRLRVPRRRAQDDLLLRGRAASSTPENAQRFSRLHPRCGTSFLLIVMIVAIFVFAPIGLPAWYGAGR